MKSVLNVLKINLILFVITLLALMFVIPIFADRNSDLPLSLAIVSQIIAFIFSIIFINKKYLDNESIKNIFDFDKKIKMKTLMYSLLLSVVLIVVEIILSLVFNIKNNSSTTDLMINNKSVLIFIYSIIIAPIIEEIFFRKFTFKMMNTGNKYFYIILSSLVFALWHIQVTKNIYQDLYVFFAIFLLSNCYGFIYERYRDVRYCIITHSVFNAISLIIAML